MTTATKTANKDAKTTYKVGDRLDVSVNYSLGDLELKDLNDKVYSKKITEDEWREEVTKRLAKKGLNYGEFDAVISNSGIDRHGEQILVEGIDLSHMKTNAPMPWSHEYANLPLGSWTKLWKSGGQLMGRGRMDYDIYDFADLAYKMLLRGTINAVSIGGIITELDEKDYTIIRKMQMVEASVVVVGAHPDAQVVSRTLNISEKKFKQTYKDYLTKAALDNVSDLGDDDIKSAIKVLKSLVATLEESAKAVSSDKGNETPEVRHIKRVTLRDSAKAVVTQSQRVRVTLKLKAKGNTNERSKESRKED